MTTDVELRDRFEQDLPAFVCEATAPYYLSRLIFQVLKDSEELNGVPSEDRAARIDRLAEALSLNPGQTKQ